MLLLPSLRGARQGGAISPSEATQLANQRQAVFVDVRPAEQYAGGHIAQSRNVPAAELEQKAAGLPKNRPLIVVCGNGRDAAKAAARLKAQGFGEVVSLAGGLAGWVQAGMPISGTPPTR
ncbi:rhodanese-like domain-containing protein [Pigmentiphaga soli]